MHSFISSWLFISRMPQSALPFACLMPRVSSWLIMRVIRIRLSICGVSVMEEISQVLHRRIRSPLTSSSRRTFVLIEYLPCKCALGCVSLATKLIVLNKLGRKGFLDGVLQTILQSSPCALLQAVVSFHVLHCPLLSSLYSWASKRAEARAGTMQKR